MRVDLSCTSSYSRTPLKRCPNSVRRTPVSQVHMRILVVGSTGRSTAQFRATEAQKREVLPIVDRRYSVLLRTQADRRTSEHRASGCSSAVAQEIRAPLPSFPAGCWSPESGLPQSHHPPRRFAAREGRPEPGSAPRQQDESSSAPVLRLAAACLTSDECCTAATVWHVRGSLVARSPSPAQSRLAARSVPGPCIRLRITALPVRVCLVYEIKIFRCHRCFGMLE